jgi:hypothetical protein
VFMLQHSLIMTLHEDRVHKVEPRARWRGANRTGRGAVRRLLSVRPFWAAPGRRRAHRVQTCLVAE